MALINCPECGKEISDHAKICIYCGKGFDSELSKKNDTNIKSKLICPNCGISINDDVCICNECGFIIKTISEKNSNEEEHMNSISNETSKELQTKSISNMINIILTVGTMIFSILSIVFFTKGYNIKNDYFSNRYVGGDAYNLIINGTYFTGYAILGSSCMICAILLLITIIIMQQKKGE